MASCELALNTLDKYRETFYSDSKNVLALNACTRADPLEVCTSRKNLELTQHVYQHKVEVDGKPMTNQKSSGRCWIFACLNVIRIPFMKHFNLEEFEFSQSYIFFWDKIERCNYMLNNIVKTAKAGEPVDGRLVSFILHDPIGDGGQWDMICNVINKYGLMPKKCFPESFSSESSMRMNAILKSVLREFAKELRALVEAKVSDEEIKAKISEQMSHIYRIVAICLSIPSEKFTWEYTEKSKVTHSIGPVTPLEFYKEHVKPLFNVDDKVCLVTDPRPTSPFGKAFTIDCLGNVVGGRPIVYNNQPVELLMKLAAESIKDNEAVWFGCEVAKRFAGKAGIEDLEIHDYKLVFGIEPSLGLTKADRLIYGDSAMTHAMVFTAVSFDDQGKPSKFRVENSWGEDRGQKGFLLMTSDWFKEFVFEVVIDKKFVSDEVLSVFQQEPRVLPAWDPMGTLALVK